jgi:predicted nucleic acid-binding protein
MIFLLDTNVLSETMKPAPSSAVASWMRKQPLRSLFTAAICQAEILAGVAVLPAGRRRTELEAIAAGMFNEDFHERILPFDGRAAAAYAQLFAARRQMGRPIATADLIVAATAHAHDAAVVTRDAGGFEGCGLVVVDPWTAS